MVAPVSRRQRGRARLTRDVVAASAHARCRLLCRQLCQLLRDEVMVLRKLLQRILSLVLQVMRLKTERRLRRAPGRPR